VFSFLQGSVLSASPDPTTKKDELIPIRNRSPGSGNVEEVSFLPYLESELALHHTEFPTQ